MIGAAPFAVQLSRLGIALAVLGGFALVYGAGSMVLATRSYQGPTDSDHRKEKWANLTAGILFVLGFAASLIASFMR